MSLSRKVNAVQDILYSLFHLETPDSEYSARRELTKQEEELKKVCVDFLIEYINAPIPEPPPRRKRKRKPKEKKDDGTSVQ